MPVMMPKKTGIQNAPLFSSSGFSLLKAISGAPPAPPPQGGASPSLGVNTDFSKQPDVTPPNQMDKQYNPMDARMAQAESDPMAVVNSTLTALKDPSVPQMYRDAIAEPLLRYKHYGSAG